MSQVIQPRLYPGDICGYCRHRPHRHTHGSTIHGGNCCQPVHAAAGQFLRLFQRDALRHLAGVGAKHIFFLFVPQRVSIRRSRQVSNSLCRRADSSVLQSLYIVTPPIILYLPVNCKSKNGGDIVFDTFPKEQPHRFLPHTMASCGGQTIRIAFKDTVTILGKQHFTGNNAPNEKIAIHFVDQNRDYFMAEWNRIVEDQYR